MTGIPIQDHNFNRLHQGTCRCVIGSLPVSYEQADAPPEEAMNALITGFVSCGLDLKYATDGSYKGIVHIPITEDNAYFNKLLTINMIADGRMENYWTLRRYMRTIQSGQTNGYPATDHNHRVWSFDNTYRNRLTWIPRIDIIFADDSFQKQQTLRFSRCYPTAISDITSAFTSPDPVTFNISFVYSFEEIIREEPPSENIIPPIGVTD